MVLINLGIIKIKQNLIDKSHIDSGKDMDGLQHPDGKRRIKSGIQWQ